MRIKKIIEVSDEPVDVEDVKTDLALSGDLDNDLIAHYITTSRRYVENYTKTSILKQQIQASFSTSELVPAAEALRKVYYNFSYDTESFFNYMANPTYSDRFTLPRPPVQEIDSASWVDESGLTTPLVVGTDYRVFDDVLILMEPLSGSTVGSYVIIYTAGYESVDDVPAEMLTAIRLMATAHYENREGLNIPPGFREILAPYRRGRLL